MIRLRHKLAIQAFRLFDQLILAFCLGLILYLRPGAPWPGGEMTALLEKAYRVRDSLGILALGVGWILIFNQFVRYNANRFIGLKSQLLDVLKATTGATFWLLVVSAVFRFGRVTSLNIVLFWTLACTVAVVSRMAIRYLLTKARKTGYNYRYLLIVGCNERARKMAGRVAAHPELGYKLVGFIAEDETAAAEWQDAGEKIPAGNHIIGQLPELKTILERGTVDELLVCLPIKERFGAVADVIALAQELGIVARLIPEIPNAMILKKLHIEDFEGEHVITLFREQMLVQLLTKRLLDIVVSGLMLLLLSPLLLAVALAIKLTSPGPVFFAQERMGMNKRRFRLFKFRSMVVDAEAQKAKLAHLNEMAGGPAFKMKNDPRITPIGRLIRKTSIDELPQLINVLKGEMSLVGPRPPLPNEVDQYDWLYRRRLSIKPGITCLWQVNGRNTVTFQQWMEFDKQYIDNWSLWLDFKILCKTIPVVLLGKGAS